MFTYLNHFLFIKRLIGTSLPMRLFPFWPLVIRIRINQIFSVSFVITQAREGPILANLLVDFTFKCLLHYAIAHRYNELGPKEVKV